MYKLPERRGGGGGGVIRAMPERKHSFFQEVFPNFLHLFGRSGTFTEEERVGLEIQAIAILSRC